MVLKANIFGSWTSFVVGLNGFFYTVGIYDYGKNTQIQCILALRGEPKRSCFNWPGDCLADAGNV